MERLYSIIIILIIAANNVSSTEVSHCTEGPFPEEVDVVNCDKEPCTFYSNGISSMTMKFRAPRYLEKIAPNAFASAVGVNLTYPLNQDDACVGITNTPCPLAKGEYVEYTYGMYIAPFFPEINLLLEFSLIDKELNDTIVCFKMSINIKKT